MGFSGLKVFGPHLIHHTQLKIRGSLAMQDFMIVDTPGSYVHMYVRMYVCMYVHMYIFPSSEFAASLSFINCSYIHFYDLK